MRRFTPMIVAAFALSIAAPAFGGPFSDVPKGHWAYKAIDRATQAGILTGADGKFNGKSTLNRYQMAVVVSRMLDRIETTGGKHGKKDIENLEALTIEFADELALLNVKVSTLEEGMQHIKKDVDSLKKESAQGGSKAGISGLMQGRFAVTGDDANHLRGAATPAATPFARTAGGVAGAAATGVAGTMPLSRFTAGGLAAPTVANPGDQRMLFDVTQVSLAVDRHFDEDYYLHLQLDFDADTEAGFVSGSNVQVNEAFVDLEKWLFDGCVRMRGGIYSLPFQRERNPEMVEYPDQLRYGFRSLDLTISPAFWDQNWEGIRNVGGGLWNGSRSDLQWQVGVTATPNPNFNKDGSILAWRQASQAGAVMTRGAGAVPAGGLFGGQRQNAADFVTAGAALYGDTLASVDTNASGGIQNSMGFYGWAGDKYEGGLRWDAGYFMNGGTVNPTASENGTASEWRGFQLNAGWWGWEDWGFMASYYSAESDSANIAGAAAGAAKNFIQLGLYPVLAAGLAYPSVDSTSMSVLANYRFNDKNNISARYENVEDTLGRAEISARIITLDWNHRISTNSLLQLEYVTPESDSVTVIPTAGTAAAATGVGAAARNTTDVKDDLVQLNYKVRF